MSESTKIEFRYRRVSQLDDITDLVAMLLPGNRNQQHAAARILLTLKQRDGIMPSLGFLQRDHGISRRTLERTRATGMAPFLDSTTIVRFPSTITYRESPGSP